MLRALAFSVCCLATVASHAAEITVYAAASLTDVMQTLTERYMQSHPVVIKTAFASSSKLAKQITAGAPADIYVSADTQWMDYLQARQLIHKGSRQSLLSNSLVLIAPASSSHNMALHRSKPLAARFEGKLCMGDPHHVPAGRYAQQALQRLGWWDTLAKRVVATEDVRAALVFVQRGECSLGVVYATDVRNHRQVVVAGRFTPNLHDPIIYPMTLLPHASAQAHEFYRYLQSAAAKTVYRQAGFIVLTH